MPCPWISIDATHLTSAAPRAPSPLSPTARYGPHVWPVLRDVLLATSRTVIEGDSFSVCHRLFAVPGTVHLVPQPLEDATEEAMHIFVGADGLVTIESTACYRCVSIATPMGDGGDDPLGVNDGGPQEWARVRTAVIENLFFNPATTPSARSLLGGGARRNVRHLKIMVQLSK